MRKYSPGASISNEYAYGCDNCGEMDGRPVLIWDRPQGRGGHFSVCLLCLGKLYMEYAAEADKVDESVFVSRATITEAVRNEIFHRDGYVCVDCGSGIDLQIDHIIPFSRGGLTEKSNLQTMCRKCNSKKGNRI